MTRCRVAPAGLLHAGILPTPRARPPTLHRTMSLRLLPILVATAALSNAAVDAQAVRALPRAATDAYAGASTFSIPPLAFRAQYWFSAENLPGNLPIHQLGLRLSNGGQAPALTRDIEIVVADSTLTAGTISSSFAANLGASPTTFFARRSVNFTAVSPITDPNLAGAWFPGDAPFVHGSGGFVVEFRAGQANNATVVPNDSFVVPATGSRTLHLQGRASCGGALRGSYSGGSVTWAASGLPAGVPVTLNLGVENVSFGGLDLPVDLAGIGLPGCHLGIASIASANLVSDSAGQASLSLPFTLGASTSLTLSAQAVHGRVANPQQPSDFATTNVVNSALGSVGLCNALFATPDNAPTAQQGPFNDNRSIVILVR